MLHSLKERFDREDEGFTLIELMVVVLIIAILLAIAIPTFLGARDSANARSAQSNLRNALTAEQTYWTNNQAWDVAPASGTAGSVAATETSLDWQTTAPAAGSWNGNTVLVGDDTAANNGVELTALAKDGNCYTIEAIDQPGGTAASPAGTYYYQEPATSGVCATPTGPTAAATQGSAAKTPKTWMTSF